MGWFNKKKGSEQEKIIPKLPELPKLPSLPPIKEEDQIEPIHQLPRFPNNSFGEKFSQNAIKEAVAGEKEDEDAFETEDLEMSQRHLKKPLTKEVPEEFKEAERVVKKSEPIFIRIDKFEESLKIFENTKTKISEIEKMLKEIKKTKEDEEKELVHWENEIKIIKGQIEKVDKEIFSKIE